MRRILINSLHRYSNAYFHEYIETTTTPARINRFSQPYFP